MGSTAAGQTKPIDLGVLIYSDIEISETVKLAQLSERLGYKYFWYTDVRFARECYVGLACIAQATERILIAPGVTDPYSLHPSLTAGAIATLDEISDGRAVLGIGIGGTGFKELGLKANLPIAAMREAVEMFRGLMRGEKVSVDGKVVSLNGGQLSFTPRRPDVPVFFATHGMQMSRLAGRIADGILIANTLSPAAYQQYVDQVDDGLKREGRSSDSMKIGLRVEACISADTEAALTVMRQRVAGRIIKQYPHWDYLDKLGLRLPEEFVALGGREFEAVIDEAARLIPLEIVDSMVLAGNPDRVATRLQQALHPRVTHITLRPHAVQGESLSSVVEAFSDRVMPKVRQAQPT
ncbi:MAG: LLM class flavin-dependent oxidoreductase [Boseongicola sp.]